MGDIFPNLSQLVGAGPGPSQDQIALDVHMPPQITDVTEVGDIVTTTNLRAAAASPRLDCPKVDFLQLSPELPFGEQSYPPFVSSDQPNGEDASRFQEAVLATDAPQNLPKSFQEKCNWPLHVHRNASQCAELPFPLDASVYRLTPAYCGPGFYKHDRRALRLQEGQLDVFEKASVLKVKTSLRVKLDVEECSLLPGGRRLSLVIRRVPPGADIDSGVWDMKSYYFEFASVDEATAFHSEISRLLRL